MASTRPASPWGTRIVLAAWVVVAAAGCTSPNPIFGMSVTPDGGVGGVGGMQTGLGGQGAVFGTGGQPGGQGGQSGSDALPAGDTNRPDTPFGTGGVPGTGGTTTPGTGGIANPGTGGTPVDSGRGGAMGDGGAGTGGTTPVDMAPPVDMNGGVGTGPAPAVCGTSNINLASIVATRGLAIQADGTTYFTRESGAQAWIGRIKPGSAAESSWFTLPPNAQPRIVRVDGARNSLYIAASGVNALYVVSLVTGALGGSYTIPAPHGIAVMEDGGMFVSTGDGHIHFVRFDLTITRHNQATDAVVFPIGQRPLGLAIAPNGRLFVGSSAGGMKHYRIEGDKLVDGMSFGSYSGTANDLAFDHTGRLYVADSVGTTSKQLVQITNNGATVSNIGQVSGRLTSLAFGRGTTRCDDLHIGDAAGVTLRWTTPAAGLDLP